MHKRDVAALVGAAVISAHAIAILKDGERWTANVRRLQASPTFVNLVAVLVAEGVLVKDLGWFM